MNLADRALDWFTEHMASWVLLALGVIAVVLLIAAGISSMATSTSPHIALPKDEWQCTETRTRTYTQMMLVGKVMVPQTMTETICVNYARRP